MREGCMHLLEFLGYLTILHFLGEVFVFSGGQKTDNASVEAQLTDMAAHYEMVKFSTFSSVQRVQEEDIGSEAVYEFDLQGGRLQF
jgi:hypothetical protein